MTTHNDITGDKIQSRAASQAYLDNYDLIFNKERTVMAKKDKSFEEKGRETVMKAVPGGKKAVNAIKLRKLRMDHPTLDEADIMSLYHERYPDG